MKHLLEVLISIACCLGNVLVVCAVCVGVRDSLQEPTFCFLASLAVADFLVGVVAVSLAVLLNGWVSLTPDLCLLLFSFSTLYFCFIPPSSIKKKVCLCARCFSVCWGLLPFGFKFQQYIFPVLQLSSMHLPVSVTAPLLVMTLLYAQIFWSSQGHLKENCPQAQASLLREKHPPCSLALFLILFANYWISLHLMNCLLLFHGPQTVTQRTIYTGLFFPGILLSHANSAINPVTYAYRIPKIQQAYSQRCRHFS
uniref:adenosine receptor A3 n=1 Tax=Monopterus albus TaxID=43700 RepID=UPI0009B37A22|nr:adenosine receptor A3-like [Monopterus albus]